MAAALAVAAIVALGAALPTQALAADDDGSATSTADIVLVAPDDNGTGEGGGSVVRGATTKTGDPIAWAPVLAIGLLAAGVAVFARRQALAGAQAGPTARRTASTRPAASARPAARRRPSAYARPGAHARSGSHAKRSAVNWGRVGVAALVIALVALAASTFMVLSARAANDAIRIEMQQAEDGSWSGTTTYYVNNDATYYRDLAKITEAAANGFNLEDGSVAITVAPASDPDDAIASPDAVKGAATSGAAWRIAGSAVSDDHNLALKVTATAKSLKPGDNTVGTATFDMTAPVYEDLRVRLSTSPAVGKPLAASITGAPEEAQNDFTYTWLVSDDGENWEPVEGASDSTYTPTADVAGKLVSVMAACANPAWFAVVPANYQAAAPVSDAPAPGSGQHLVIFDVNGHGDAPEAQIVADGGFATRPADPKAAGWRFVGWYADEDRTVSFDFASTPITQDTVIYGLWEEGNPIGSYTVAHLLQDFSDDSVYNEDSREVRSGEFAGGLADLAKAFTGYVPARFEADAEGDADYKVYYDRRAYKVTFHANNAVFGEVQEVRFGDEASEPSAQPTMTGKVFRCWSLPGSTAPYAFNTPVSGDVDLYAQWDDQVLKVTFETWGQSPQPADQEVVYGSTATEPASPAQGSGPTGGPTFQGWYTDATFTTSFNFSAPITADTVVYGKYFPQVLFDVQGKGTNVALPVSLDEGVNISTADPYKTVATATGSSGTASISATGYKILSWHDDAACTSAAVTSLANLQADKTVYAKFEPITYKVKFDAHLGSGEMVDQTFTYDVAQALSSNAFTRPGYEFRGWNDAKDGSGAAYTDGQSVVNLVAVDGGEVTLYAQWEASSSTQYTVKHLLQKADKSGYDEDASAQQTLTGRTGAQTVATAKAYRGYTAQAIAQQAIAADGSTVVEVKYDLADYTVTFDLNGATGTVPTSQTKAYGALVDKPADPTPEAGYEFKGWFTDIAGTQAWDFSSDGVQGDMTLYAKWEGKSFTISFDANAAGATGGTASITAKVGDAVVLTQNGFTRAGYTFAGWNTAADGSGTFFADKASTTAAAVSPSGTDVTLYAQWIGNQVTYKVHHVKENPTTGAYDDVDGSDDVLPGMAGSTTAAAARTITGYDAQPVTQATIAGDGSTVVEVQYKLKEYTVTFQTWGFATVQPNKTITVKHGQKATPPASPATPDSNTPAFQGWYSDFNLSTLFDFASTPITQATTVYSKYSPDVLVDFQGKAPNASIGATMNESFQKSKLNGVVPAGYKIKDDKFYWDSSFTSGNEVTFPFTVDSTHLNSSNTIVIYADLEALTDTPYKVEHYRQTLASALAQETAGGSYTLVDADFDLVETESKSGTTGQDTAAQAKTGGAYDGFSCAGTDMAGSGTITQKTIAGDGNTVVKVYYTRTKVNYTVEHHQQDLTGTGYTKVDADTQTLQGFVGDTTAATAKTYAGFTAKAFTQRVIAATGTVVAIYYDRDTVTLSFDMQGHGTQVPAQTLRAGATATTPAAPADSAYDFMGWYDEAACTTSHDFAQPVMADQTLFAKWQKKKFTVTFDVDVSMGTAPADQTVEYGDFAADPGSAGIAKAGYNFLGWFEDAGFLTPFDFAAKAIKAATTVYGKLEAITYEVTYYGDTDPDYPTQAKTHGVDLTLSQDKLPDSIGMGDDAKYVMFNKNDGSASSWLATELYGPEYRWEHVGWEGVPVSSTTGEWKQFKFNEPYNIDDDIDLQDLFEQKEKVKDPDPIVLPSASRTGYYLAGWYTEKTGGTKVGGAGDEYVPTDDVTRLYAQWVDVNKARIIHFNAKGTASGTEASGWGYTGEGTMADQIVENGKAYTIDECKFTAPSNDPDLKFLGWNTEQSGGGRWVLPGETIAATDTTMSNCFVQNSSTKLYEITLYAQWSHLTGLTAATLADDANYDTYSRYVGELWIPVNEDGSYDKLNGVDTYKTTTANNQQVDRVMIATLIGAGHDGENMLTFMSTRSLPAGVSMTSSNDVSNYIYRDTFVRTRVTSGNVYDMLPASLKASGVAKPVTKSTWYGHYKKNASESYSIRSTDAFWLLSFTEVGVKNKMGNQNTLSIISGDGKQYDYFAKHPENGVINAAMFTNSGVSVKGYANYDVTNTSLGVSQAKSLLRTGLTNQSGGQSISAWKSPRNALPVGSGDPSTIALGHQGTSNNVSICRVNPCFCL